MRSILLLTAALMAAALAGCRGVSPEMAKSADDVRVSIEEADRAFLYSQVAPERLLEMVREGEQLAAAPLYVYDADTGQVTEISPAALSARRAGESAVIAVSVETHAATVNLWNWARGDVERLSLRLDGLAARRAGNGGPDAEVYDVLLAARQSSLLPLCGQDDYEIFQARIAAREDGSGALLGLEQLTHNGWDDVQPAFSPDGNWIVFVSAERGVGNVALMDYRGGSVGLLTTDQESSARFPAVLPNNEECLYVAESGGISDFFIVGLDGSGPRRASPGQLKQMLFSWDDATRHTYLATDVFAQNRDLRLLLDLPQKVDLLDAALLAEWNAPLLKEYREKIRAARAERQHNARERGAVLSARGMHMIDVGVFVDEPEQNPFDRAVEGFTRLLFTLSIPLFQGPLNKAIEQRDTWQEVVYSQTYLKRYNELVYNVVRAHFDYSEQTAKADLLGRVLDLERKRLFILRARAEAGEVLPGKVAEGEGHLSAARAALAEARAGAEAARARLRALIGVGAEGALQIEPAALDWREPPHAVPPLEELEALAQVNHPDLERLKFLELRAAAIRDMGPPETRSRTTLDLTYGHGSDHFFSKTVDDFISAGLAHALPLEKLGLERAYREQWTHEMLAHRRARQQARLDVSAELRQTHAALNAMGEELTAENTWRAVTAEKARLARIYAAHQAPAGAPQPDVTDQIQAELDDLRQRVVLAGVRAEFMRHLAACYYRAGLARRLLEVLAGAQAAPLTRTRSVWLWRSLEVVNDPGRRERFLRTCAEQGINRVYCFVARVGDDYYLQRHYHEFGHFLDLCAEQGITVYALAGNPHWVEEGQRAEVGGLVRSVVRFNARAQQGATGFAGLKLDVEPHALPAWRDEDGRRRLARAYLDVIDHARAVLGRDGAGLRLAADVPPTYLGVEAGEPGDLFGAVCSRVDELTLMAYRDSAARIVAASVPALEAAAGHGVAVEIGVETAADQPKGISFAGQSIEALVVALDAVYERLIGREAFAGFAIHDYTSLAQLIEKSHGH